MILLKIPKIKMVVEIATVIVNKIKVILEVKNQNLKIKPFQRIFHSKKFLLRNYKVKLIILKSSKLNLVIRKLIKTKLLR